MELLRDAAARARRPRRMLLSLLLVLTVWVLWLWRWVHRCQWVPLRSSEEETARQWRELTVYGREVRGIVEECAGKAVWPWETLSCWQTEWTALDRYFEERCGFWTQ